MSKILITGASSKICTELIKLLPDWCLPVLYTSKNYNFTNLTNIKTLPILECDYLVLAHGCLNSRVFLETPEEELLNLLKINLLSIITIIELALANPHARIVVIGSESGVKGSFDVMYGLCKSALHKYVEEKKIVFPEQQLVCVAPSLISDCGMTIRRKDQQNVVKSVITNPKQRGLQSEEVAKMIHNLLFVDCGYTTNCVVHMNGGKFARS